jgi:hypothetical protein
MYIINVVLDCKIIYILVVFEHTTGMSRLKIEYDVKHPEYYCWHYNPRLLQSYFLLEEKSVCWCNSEGSKTTAEEFSDINKGREIGDIPKFLHDSSNGCEQMKGPISTE